ncbi:collagen alpha-2(I) chain-like [Bacillus rossius redtenbacheri]|uniref:collagen alpha-2(I) chain-like n=1 Tax=Bacillus rossius redtenbacheri TaxID=93214 RepID=UPI002FDD0C48
MPGSELAGSPARSSGHLGQNGPGVRRLRRSAGSRAPRPARAGCEETQAVCWQPGTSASTGRPGTSASTGRVRAPRPARAGCEKTQAVCWQPGTSASTGRPGTSASTGRVWEDSGGLLAAGHLGQHGPGVRRLRRSAGSRAPRPARAGCGKTQAVCWQPGTSASTGRPGTSASTGRVWEDSGSLLAAGHLGQHGPGVRRLRRSAGSRAPRPARAGCEETQAVCWQPGISASTGRVWEDSGGLLAAGHLGQHGPGVRRLRRSAGSRAPRPARAGCGKTQAVCWQPGTSASTGRVWEDSGGLLAAGHLGQHGPGVRRLRRSAGSRAPRPARAGCEETQAVCWQPGTSARTGRV